MIPEWRVKSDGSKNYTIEMANGESMKVHGEATVDIEIDGKRMSQRVFVASIVSPVILGMDFMEKYHVTLDVSRRQIMMGGE